MAHSMVSFQDAADYLELPKRELWDEVHSNNIAYTISERKRNQPRHVSFYMAALDEWRIKQGLPVKKPWIKVSEAARMLHVGVSAVYRMRHLGKIELRLLGKVYYCRRSEVEKIITNRLLNVVRNNEPKASGSK